MSAPWIWLIVAAVFEMGWALMLPLTSSFTRLVPSALTLVMLAASMFGLAVASRSLPIGTAYAVWVGIGAVGTTVFGIVVHGDTRSLPRLLFVGLLVIAIAGLKLTSGSSN